jgi:uncharacterized repeat protein (TIGR03803 family)
MRTTSGIFDFSSTNFGTVFKVNRDGSGYTVLHRFTGVNGDGKSPYGGVVEGSDGELYGTTYGGSYGVSSTNYGSVFKVNRDGSGYAVLHRFSLKGGDGNYPSAGVVEGSDGVIYGTTTGYRGPVVTNYGTVFKVNKDGSGYGVLHSFNATNRDGKSPAGALVEGSDGVLYGTTRGGGYGAGTLFALNRDGSGYTVVRGFLYASGGDGQGPEEPLRLLRNLGR